MRRFFVVPLLIAAVALPAIPAQAGPPPRGLYECTIGEILFDDVKILKDKRYERFGKVGKFASKGKKINFLTGPFKGFKGHWDKFVDSNGVTYEIALKNPIDDFESIYCDT